VPECQGAVRGVGHLLGVAMQALGNQREPSQILSLKAVGKALQSHASTSSPKYKRKKEKGR